MDNTTKEAPALPATTEPRQQLPQIGGLAWGSPRNLEEALKLADVIADSDIVPKDYRGKPGNVLVAMQMGAELGLAPMAALQNIAVVNGRPSLWGDAMLAIVKAHPLYEWIREDDDGETATCTIKRRNEPEVVRTFSMAEAKAAGLTSKESPWKSYPKRMRQMRARAFALRDAFPDALRGLAVAEEQMDAKPIEHEVVATEPQAGTKALKDTLRKRRSANETAAPETMTEEQRRTDLDQRYFEVTKAMAKDDPEKHARILDDLDEQSKERHGVPVDGLQTDALRKLVEGLEAKAK